MLRKEIKPNNSNRRYPIIVLLRRSLTLLSITLFCYAAYGQMNTSNTKYLSIGSRTSGICFGNSHKYNGFRLNIWDKNWDYENVVPEKINGINVSLSANNDAMNGLQVVGISGYTRKLNGLSIATVGQGSEKINGAATGFIINSDTLNGVFVGFGIGAPNRNIVERVINGLTISIFVNAEKISGVAIGLGENFSKRLNGLSIFIFNNTEELHGLQIGLLNYAGNNPGLFKWLPFANFHL